MLGRWTVSEEWLRRGGTVSLVASLLVGIAAGCGGAEPEPGFTNPGGSTGDDTTTTTTTTGDDTGTTTTTTTTTPPKDAGTDSATLADGSTPVTDSGMPILAGGCAMLLVCTNDVPASAPVGFPATLSGGTIVDGLYRAEAGTGVGAGFLFQGTSVLEIGLGNNNLLGAYTTTGSTLAINFTSSCTSAGTSVTTSAISASYLMDTTSTAGQTILWLTFTSPSGPQPTKLVKTAISAVCTADSSFTCQSSGSCSCTSSSGTVNGATAACTVQ